MVVRENVKSNFVRGLGEKHNLVITYATIFFTLAFLGCILAFWIYEYRGNRCVFGPSCCFTELVNNSKQSTIEEANMTQRGTSAGWIPGSFPEQLTFNYATSPDSDSGGSFQVDLYKDGTTVWPTGTTVWPTGTTNTGFCMNAHGISFYLTDYYNGTHNMHWKNSHQLIQHGLSVWIDTYDKSDNLAVALTDNGFNYITKTNDGTKNTVITTTTIPAQSYFTKLSYDNEGGGKGLKFVTAQDSDSITYNPFTDFMQAKKNSSKLKDCNKDKGEHGCMCVDPSSKNLPSCKNPYVDGKGYVILGNKNNKVGYSQTCSYSYFPGHDGTCSGTAGTVQHTEQLIPKGSQVAGDLNKESNDCKAGCDSVDIQLGACPFGKHAFQGAISSYQNAYIANNLFCARGTKGDQKLMYPNSIHGTDNQEIGKAMRASVVPNAKKDGNKYVLGFK